MSDPFQTHAIGLSSPLTGGFAISPSDAVDLAMVTRQIRVTGSGGALAVVWQSGVETVEPVAAGEVLDWRVRRVKATGPTAPGLRGYY